MPSCHPAFLTLLADTLSFGIIFRWNLEKNKLEVIMGYGYWLASDSIRRYVGQLIGWMVDVVQMAEKFSLDDG